jgi:type I restriction enzyme, S subunit
MKPWPEIPLAEVAKPISRTVEVIPGQSYRTIGVKWWGEGAYERETIDGSRTAAKTLSVVRRGDLIINKIWVRHGSTAVAGRDVDGCAASGEFPTFHLDENRVVPRWLHWQTKTRGFWAKCDALSRGTSGKNRIKPELFLTIRVPLPPLVEQRRVVARIEELAAQIHEARTLRHQATEEAEALYTQQLAVAMTPHGKGWKRQVVADVIKSMDAGWSPQCDDIPAREGEWGVLKTTAVQWCDFQPQHNKALPPTLAPLPGLVVKQGDVLVTRAGPRRRVAVVAAVRCDEPRLTISDKLIRLRTDRAKIEPRFLELSLASPFSQEHLVQRKTGLADAQVNISQAILKATPVAYPAPPEQRRIVAELDALQAEVDALKRLQAETAAELDALLPSILDNAFKGEL